MSGDAPFIGAFGVTSPHGISSMSVLSVILPTSNRVVLLTAAVDRQKNADLVATMSNKLEAVIKAEIGTDDGREMPEVGKITWTIDRADL